MLPYDLLYPIFAEETKRMKQRELQKYALALCMLNKQFLQVGRQLLYSTILIRSSGLLSVLANTICATPALGNYCSKLRYTLERTDDFVHLHTGLIYPSPHLDMLVDFRNLQTLEWFGNAFEDLVMLLLTSPAKDCLRHLKLHKVQLAPTSKPLSSLLDPAAFPGLETLRFYPATPKEELKADDERSSSSEGGMQQVVKIKHCIREVDLMWSRPKDQIAQQEIAQLPETLCALLLYIPTAFFDSTLSCLGSTKAHLTRLNVQLPDSRTRDAQLIAAALGQALPDMVALKNLYIKCAVVLPTFLIRLPESLESLGFEGLTLSDNPNSRNRVNVNTLRDHLSFQPSHLPNLGKLELGFDTLRLSKRIDPFLKEQDEEDDRKFAATFARSFLSTYHHPMSMLELLCSRRSIRFTWVGEATLRNLHGKVCQEYDRREERERAAALVEQTSEMVLAGAQM